MRITGVFICILLLLTGCSAKSVSLPEDLIGGFSCNVEMTYSGMEIRGTAKGMKDGTYRFDIASPDVLEGLVIQYDGKDLQMQYKGMDWTMEGTALPETAFVGGIISALNQVRTGTGLEVSKSGDQYEIVGECGSGKFSLHVTKDGKLVNLSIPALELEVMFLDFQFD